MFFPLLKHIEWYINKIQTQKFENILLDIAIENKLFIKIIIFI